MHANYRYMVEIEAGKRVTMWRTFCFFNPEMLLSQLRCLSNYIRCYQLIITIYLHATVMWS